MGMNVCEKICHSHSNGRNCLVSHEDPITLVAIETFILFKITRANPSHIIIMLIEYEQ